VKYNLTTAYLLWLLSGFGALGFHRFYLGKTGTGLLWLFTGGLGGLGSLYDLITLPRQVREANLEYAARQALGYNDQYGSVATRHQNESPERIILKLAKANNGMVTAGDVAIEANIPLEEAQRQLDSLAKKGLAQVRIRSSGALVYFSPNFPRMIPILSIENFPFVSCDLSVATINERKIPKTAGYMG